MTIRRCSLVCVAVCLLIASSRFAFGQSPRPERRASRTETPPAIDGALDDEVWQSAPLETGEWMSYDPLYGKTIPQHTTVWVAYDADALYFAFKCDDPEPAGVRTSVTRRDNIFQDDWVGLSLDALGTGQTSYHMMVNPSGVQLDMLNSVANSEDSAPDWIWDSAARLTPTGYTVEIRLPLQSIRFAGGVGTRMGILFWRRVSRLGISVSWPALAPGVWVFERHASLAFDEIRPRLAREVLPSVTYSRQSRRATPEAWGPADDRGDVGFSAKVGVTPTITVEATVNPDFSQVESDAYQVDVNQRFPIFYSEKRPFFMEGAGTFSLAGQNGDSSLQTAVHSRTIVDPIFGAKVTGSAGRVTFATLSAIDESPGHFLEPGTPGAGRERYFNIGRAQYSLGPSNYVGAIVTDVRFDGGSNQVVGADGTWRLTPAQRIEGFAMLSRTTDPGARDSATGVGAQFNYSYETRKYAVRTSAEHYDRGFRMDTAFLRRAGLTSGWAYLERSFYPSGRYGWVRRIAAFTFLQGGRDRIAGGRDIIGVTGVRFNVTRQGFLRVDRSYGVEPWAGQRFDRGRTRAFGQIQAFRWLNVDAEHSTGRAVFYDAVRPFAGRSRDSRLTVTLQPNGRLSEALTFNRVAFDARATGDRVYTLHIVNSKTTYQFTRALAVRALLQYDSSRERVLTDMLGSYEPRPGTVVYIGYGSLIERRGFAEDAWVPGTGRYRTTERGLFFKTSYLYRF